jgi:hypothetical protein
MAPQRPSLTVRKRARRAVGSLFLFALAVAAVAGVTAMLMNHDDGDTSRSAAARSAVDTEFSTARDGLCAAAARARTGDAPGARSLFFERSHQPLHKLAAAAQEKDRAAAAQLLEAKFRVEGSLEPPHTGLADNLQVLAQAAGRAMWALGGNDPGPCAPQ